MKKDLISAKKIIDSDCITSPTYSQLYMFTTENIKGIINKIDLNNKKILTVCSSSDHLFNFLLEGSSTVETFDVNIFTEYFFYLKRATIINLTYNEFLEFFFPKYKNKKKVFSKDTYNLIKKDIPEGRVRYFWDELFTNYSSSKLYNSSLFIKNKPSLKTIIYCNKYLNNESNYNSLKKILINYNKLNFYNINIFNDVPKLDSKVDFIYLSNIFDYLIAKNKIEYLNKIKDLVLKFSNNLKDTGMIGVCYLYCYLDGYWYTIKDNNLQTLVNENDFIKKEYKIIDFRSSLNIKSTRTKDIDALMLYKKK